MPYNHDTPAISAVRNSPSQGAASPSREDRLHLPETQLRRSTADDLPESCIHQRFRRQARRTPDAVAVECNGAAVTYATLDARSDALASTLRRSGVGPESLVGICLDRGEEFVTALLATWKAGGAFLPLDPSYPRERLAVVAADAGLRWVVTSARLAGRLPAGVEPVVVSPAAGEPGEEEGPAAETSPDHAAYVIYTSGSTGTPRGVVVPHRAILNHALAIADDFALAPGDRVLQFASPAFDVALEEILPTLLRGATLVVREAAAMDSLSAFLEMARARALTVWNLPSAYWHELVGELERSGAAVPASLRLLVVGSEAASALALERWTRIAGERVAFRNAYGPTEATITATLHAPAGEGARDDLATVPVGRPIRNVRTHVVDARGREVAEGSAGELCLGGAGIARGYLGRPAATAERFVPDPFSPVPGARLYRTGDRARLRGGALEFLGRMDRQVKVRGFRVAPEEIEAALRAHPAVREAAVVLREDVPGRARLAGYAASDSVDGEALRVHLAGRLPAYMVPEAVVVLSALPLTPAGKVDRRALPAPEGRERGEAPREGAEARIAGVWREVLRVDDVGRDEPFLALGGNSLLAAQVVSRLRNALGVELSVPALLEAGTVAGVARTVERGETGARTAAPSPRPGPVEGDHPLSLSQERALFMSRLQPTSLAYQFQAAFRFRGALDVAVLERSLEEMLRRHAILRTSFPEVDGAFVQRVHPVPPVRLSREELRGIPAAQRRAEADRVIRAELEHLFDLSEAPLVRWRLLRMEDDVWEMVHVEHHIVHDGWSFNVFLGELLEIYRAFIVGCPSPLAEPVLQFADYAAWQREWLEGPEAAAQLEYWTARLAGAPPLLEFPTDRPRPAVQRFRGDVRRMEFSAAEAGRLRAFGAAHDATLYTSMVSAFAALLHRHGGADDLCVGAAVANRRWREVEGMIGMFVNSLVLRLGLEGDPTFAGLVARARRTTLEAWARQDLPFDRVVQALAPERSLGHTPLHQVLFSFDDARMPEVEVPGLAVTVREGLANGSAKFDMTILVAPRGHGSFGLSDGWEAGGLTMIWEYDSDLFDGATVERMLQQYRRLLLAGVEAPHRRISELEMVDEAERRLLTAGWSRGEEAPAAAPLVHEAFAAQAARSPEAPAVAFEGQTLTYRALDERANRLAHHLVALGVGPEVRVGLCLERGLETVVSILAILKAGGAWVPLDPGHPAERRTRMAADAGGAVVITRGPMAGTLEVPAGTAVVDIDADAAEIAARGAETPPARSLPENLAYVIFTSGSTGTPKGVAVQHGALANHMTWFNRAFGIDAGDRVLQKTPAGFDASVWEFFAPLLSGGCLVVARHDGERDPRYLARTVRDQGITVVQLVPTLLRVLLDEPEVAECRSLRRVFCGGEALSGDLCGRLAELLPQAKLVNLYGPTECCIDSSTHACAADDALLRTAPIGRPVPGTRAYVLDAAGEPVPAGVPGELYVGGVQVARGYLGRAALTAERFVPDPFSARPGARAYRTGDRARWVERSAEVRECVRADVGPAADSRTDALTPSRTAVLEYLGRLDEQVKVRGFRVELGEVDAALRGCPGVADSVVVAREDGPGGTRLLAYVVGDVDADALRAGLRRTLPEYMVPSAFTVMDALPVTPNGKLDRGALPVPDPRPAVGRVAPRNRVEEVLAEIWGEVLGVDEVGVNENFFALGGHSLLAMRVVTRIRQLLDGDAGVSAFFESPTIEGLAPSLSERAPAGAAGRGASPAVTAASSPHRAMAMLDEMDEEEMDRLLALHVMDPA